MIPTTIDKVEHTQADVTGAVVGVFHYDNASRSELSDAGIATP